VLTPLSAAVENRIGAAILTMIPPHGYRRKVLKFSSRLSHGAL
jgi:hypothetical protein